MRPATTAVRLAGLSGRLSGTASPNVGTQRTRVFVINGSPFLPAGSISNGQYHSGPSGTNTTSRYFSHASGFIPFESASSNRAAIGIQLSSFKSFVSIACVRSRNPNRRSMSAMSARNFAGDSSLKATYFSFVIAKP